MRIYSISFDAGKDNLGLAKTITERVAAIDMEDAIRKGREYIIENHAQSNAPTDITSIYLVATTTI